MNENSITGQIVDAAYRVHTTLGPGLLESVYEAALAFELAKRGLGVTRQQCVPVIYEQVHIHAGFFADLVVDDQIIVEIKSVDVICTGTQEAASDLPETGR
jgi:GxxExxY protein